MTEESLKAEDGHCLEPVGNQNEDIEAIVFRYNLGEFTKRYPVPEVPTRMRPHTGDA